jgi:hypothetical protein
MTKKNVIVLAITLVAVIGFYLYLFRDSFAPKFIHISHTIRLNQAYLRHPSANTSPEDAPRLINFVLNGPFKLTSVKLVPAAEFETNKFAHPLWELVTDSNSAPTRAFTYGLKIKGMHTAVKGATADPLVPNVTYRLLVETKSLKGQHDFSVSEDSHLTQ